MPFLEKLKNFHLVGYGCTTCIGNMGPYLKQSVQRSRRIIWSRWWCQWYCRNFEGRIHPLVRANYLASPPLVVAYVVAGRMDLDLTKDALVRRGWKTRFPERNLADPARN